MARNTKPGKKSDSDKKLEKEQKATEERNAGRHEENLKEEARKAEAAKEESDNQAEPVAKADMKDSEREKAWKQLLETYEKQNPVKYAQKKANGEFKEMPANFTGTNQLHVTK